ncbi:type IV secretory system conjugative DNA transfer family protein [Sinomonas humi]|uniref:TraD/TraG TraM recognition site domain-containing protein n=1 Tax=Sinomonas humi TaxID=1338436 RepID=A0A0B2AK92_9MICC|nr:TraM recognition domain-containing protein [Sinomonas humi]KHL03791.1 hypothetical protein LK10_08350 [Sinomonas humi]
MSSATIRGARPGSWSGTWMPVVLVVAAAAAVDVSAWVGEWLTPTGTDWGFNPLSVLLLWATGTRIPPASVAMLAVFAAALLWALVKVFKGRGRVSPAKKIRAKAELLASAEEVAAVTFPIRAAEARRMHPDNPDVFPGLHIGRWVLGSSEWLLQGLRQCALFVMGPGRGKTTGLLVRAARYTAGAYGMAGNKVDGVREVLAARAIWHPGGQVWMMDMQQVFRKSGKPSFTFNPLLGIKDSEQATNLAAVLEAATLGGGDKNGDAQFDEQGRSFLAACILAQALQAGTMEGVHEWVANADFLSPRRVLLEAPSRNPEEGMDFRRQADQLFGMSRQPADTKGSVAASAQRMASSLIHDHLLAWIRPTAGVPEFDPAKYLTSHDTLIALSKGSSKVVTGLMTAFWESIFAMGERLAEANGGRLKTPATFDLDEFGNTVILPKMPDWFTYFGSMGMNVRVFIQSEAFGKKVLGEAGWDTLRDAAGIWVFGGGVRDEAYLTSLSKLLGKHDEYVASYTSNERGPASRNISTRREEIFGADELFSLPMWHAIVHDASSGVKTVVRIVPWFQDDELRGPIQAALDAGKERK